MILSNKSQYILSKIGIPLYTDAKNLSVSDEINIHFFQKDNILTLHANSVDEYSEKEIKIRSKEKQTQLQKKHEEVKVTSWCVLLTLLLHLQHQAC